VPHKFPRAVASCPTAQDQALRARADAAIAHTKWVVNEKRLVLAAVAVCHANRGVDVPGPRGDDGNSQRQFGACSAWDSSGEGPQARAPVG
jgi:hypothetical protein